MTFNPSIPLTGDSPGIFPAQSQANFTRLQTIIEQDHQFNNTAETNDGWHNIVHLTAQAPVAAGPPAAGRLYAQASGLGRLHAFYMDDTPGTSLQYQITPTMPIRAAVNFTMTTRNSQYNVSSITRLSIGAYQIFFTTAMPDTNYIVQVSGQATALGVGDIVIGGVAGNGGVPYGNAIQTTFVVVIFVNGSGSLVDPTTGHVTIFSVT